MLGPPRSSLTTLSIDGHDCELPALRGTEFGNVRVSTSHHWPGGEHVQAPAEGKDKPQYLLRHFVHIPKLTAAAQDFEHLILVLPCTPAIGIVQPKSIQLFQDLIHVPLGVAKCSSVSDAGGCLAHINIASNGTATLVEELQPLFQFNGEQDWHAAHVHAWKRLLYPLRDDLRAAGSSLRILELGCSEGRSTDWLRRVMLQSLLAQMPDLTSPGSAVTDAKRSRMVCVGHFGSLRTAAGRKRRQDLEVNLCRTALRDVCTVMHMEEFTVPALTQLLREGAEFDLVYVDASHDRSDQMPCWMRCLAWRILEVGGIIILDDYERPEYERHSGKHPAEGIDAFVHAHREELDVLHVGYQLTVRRTVPALRGFEWLEEP